MSVAHEINNLDDLGYWMHWFEMMYPGLKSSSLRKIKEVFINELNEELSSELLAEYHKSRTIKSAGLKSYDNNKINSVEQDMKYDEN